MNKSPESEKKKNVHTLSFLVANKPGVLVRVAQVFARRGFNIDSLVVSPTVDERYSRMTITASGDPGTLDQIIKQASKLIDVIHAEEHRHESSVEKELSLIKINMKSADKTLLTQLLEKFHGQIVDKTDDAVIIEQTGTTDELDQLESELKKFGIVEYIRTGKILMARGKEVT